MVLTYVGHMPRSFDIIRKNCGTPKHGSPTYILAIENRRAKEVLCHWNMEEVEISFIKANYVSL